MIELQRYWQNILNERKKIDSYNKSLEFWKVELLKKEKESAALQKEVQNLKNELKKNELELASFNEKIKKLDQKKKLIHTEKELTAVDHEITTVKEEQSKLEDITIDLMDEHDEKEKQLEVLSGKLPETRKKIENDTAAILKNIKEAELVISQNKEKFDDLIQGLTATLQGKFAKLLNSKSGIGVAEVMNDVCTGCNFKIPASLALDAARDEKISNCTNCGRYIYKQ